jgi:pantetheine-phosphate adenylyltransferase
MTLALYPGSFDPITFGHINVIERGLKIFDRIIVGVARNVRKQALFTPDERVAMIREALGSDDRIEVSTFEGLLVQYARERGAGVILRGLRAVSDFEFEFQMAQMNKRLGSGVETVFMMTGQEHFYVSSQLVREVASFGGPVGGLVPPNVEKALTQRFRSTP